MSTSSTSTKASASADGSVDLIDQVNFQKIYDGLEQNHGILLTRAEQERLEEIIREEVRKQNGGGLAGANIGALIPNIARILFSFIQQLFGGGSNSKEFSLDNATSIIKDALSGATNTGKQGVIDQISVNIHDRLFAEGKKPEFANLRLAADLVSGLSPYGNARDIGGAAIGAQLAAKAKIPAGTSSSLNSQVQVANASDNIGNGLPATLLDSRSAQGLS